MNITELTVHELLEKLKNKELTVTEITKAYIDRINEKEKDVQAFITLLTEEALKEAESIEKKENLSELAGIPIGIKDNICTKNIKTTCASKMLENFVSPYDATVIEKLESNQNYIDSILSDLNYTKSKRDNFKSELANKVKSYKDKIILSTKRVDELALKTNKVDINQHNKTIEDIKRKITLYQNKVSDLKKLQKVPLQDLVNEVIELLENKEYTESISKLKTIRDSFSSSESYILRISKLQNKLTNEIESKNSLEKTILTLKYAKEEVKSLESRLKELKSQNPDFESVIDKQSKKLKNYKQSISKIKSQIQELEKQVNLYKWAYSEPFGNNGIKAFIFESSLSELNNLLSSYSEVLGFNIKFMVDLNSSRKDFVVNINLEGVEVFYEELSGGQKQLVNLAMALAMNQIITQSKGVNIAFLDEVFESLSYDNIEVVIGLIKKVYREKTLFLITHHESLPIPNSKILNVKREHGISAYEF